MKKVCKLIEPYKCKICNQDTLFFVTKTNMLIDYKYLITHKLNKYGIVNYLKDKNVKFIKCINCNRLFIIDWYDSYPAQLLDKSKLKRFNI